MNSTESARFDICVEHPFRFELDEVNLYGRAR